LRTEFSARIVTNGACAGSGSSIGVPIQPVTTPIALRAGQIDGESQARGVRIPLSDLLIGVSALELSYVVGTANVRHFELITGLKVVLV
jgi:predicted nucleic acid-binding protein